MCIRDSLYTYLMAKHDDGTFILRIEDTDQGRYVEGAVDVIYNTLPVSYTHLDVYKRQVPWVRIPLSPPFF